MRGFFSRIRAWFRGTSQKDPQWKPCWETGTCTVRQKGVVATLTPEQKAVLESALCHGLEEALRLAGVAIPGHPALRVGLQVAADVVEQICDAYDARHALEVNSSVDESSNLSQSENSGG